MAENPNVLHALTIEAEQLGLMDAHTERVKRLIKAAYWRGVTEAQQIEKERHGYHGQRDLGYQY